MTGRIAALYVRPQEVHVRAAEDDDAKCEPGQVNSFKTSKDMVENSVQNPDVPTGVRRRRTPAADQHDREHRDAGQVHGHGAWRHPPPEQIVGIESIVSCDIPAFPSASLTIAISL